MSDTDILIAGAGCAGLSLAVHLVEAGFTEYSITLVEPRTSYHRDRTWCFWDTEDHPFSRSISHSWSRWKVSSSEEILRGSTAYSYQHLSADDFYNDALERLRNAPNVRLLQGHEIVSMHEDAQSVSVATTSGTFRARWVFDSRPPEWSLHPGPSPHSLPDDVCLFQHFVGVHLVFDEPVVSAESIDLMDFRVSQEHGPRFVYVLPFNNREVLVENTYVSSTTLPENLHHKQLSQYIKQRWGHASYKVRHIEMGVLPMQTAPFSSDPSSRIVPIGLRGGLSKPSTGYAFLAIQRHSSQIAQRFVSEQNPAACEVRSRWNVFLDRVFLCYIHRFPEQFPVLMGRLFERVPPDSLVRFLSDCANWTDTLAVVAAMPKAPFVMELFRSFPVWARSSTRKQILSPSRQGSVT